MLIKLSDFLLEQSVSNSDISDIVIEQTMAELDVCLSLAYAYGKQLLMEEYSDTPLDEDETVTEAAAATVEISDKTKHSTGAKQEEDEDDEPTSFFKSVFKAFGSLLAVIGKKIAKLLSINIKLGKQAKKCLNRINDDEIDTFMVYLKHKQHISSTSKLYAEYNPLTAKHIIDRIDKIATKFENTVSGFKTDITLATRKTDKHNSTEINRMNRFLKEMIDSLRESDYNKENEAEQYTGVTEVTNDKFIHRMRDYINFYELKDTRKALDRIVKNIDKAALSVKKLDVHYNFTKDYRFRRVKGVAFAHTSPINRSNSAKYMDIRATLDNINAIAKGGKKSIVQRLNDISDKYFYVVEYFAGYDIDKKDAEKEGK